MTRKENETIMSDTTGKWVCRCGWKYDSEAELNGHLSVSNTSHGLASAPADYTYSGPQIMLDTAVGPVQVTFTEAGHAYVGANASSGSDPGDVVYRGRHWYVSVHLYAVSGWTEDSGDPDQGSYRHQFTEAGTFGGREVPRTYRAKIMEAITAAVREYAEAHPGTLADAEANHLYHDYLSAEKEAREIAEKLDAALAKQRELGRKLDDAAGQQWRGWDGEPRLPLT